MEDDPVARSNRAGATFPQTWVMFANGHICMGGEYSDLMHEITEFRFDLRQLKSEMDYLHEALKSSTDGVLGLAEILKNPRH